MIKLRPNVELSREQSIFWCFQANGTLWAVSLLPLSRLLSSYHDISGISDISLDRSITSEIFPRILERQCVVIKYMTAI